MELIQTKEKIVNADCFVVDLPMYHCKVYLFNPEQNKDLTEKHGWAPCTDGQARNYLSDSQQIMIRINNETPGTISHECLHAVQFIMQHIGHSPDEDGDEPSAYLLGYLVDEYYRQNKLWKQKKLKNKKKKKMDH